jgi:lysylphosphatidylglycerol synthetase-like protein (DUF2156 family)
MSIATTCEEKIDLVRKFATTASEALLDPNCIPFTSEGLEGFLGYKLIGTTAICFGDPVCSKSDWREMASRFQAFCLKQNYSWIYVMASAPFKAIAFEVGCKGAVQFGHALYINPETDPSEHTGEKGSLIRRKVRRAIKEGVVVDEYKGNNPALEKEIEEVGKKWLNARRGPQVHISHVHIFDNRPGKRWFYAAEQGRVVGVVILNRTEINQGYLLNRYLVDPVAPSGTAELLVVKALDQLRKEGCTSACCGTVLDDKISCIEGFSPLQSTIAKGVLQIANLVFGLSARKVFWDKFEMVEHPSYIVFKDNVFSIKELISLAKALNIF